VFVGGFDGPVGGEKRAGGLTVLCGWGDLCAFRAVETGQRETEINCEKKKKKVRLGGNCGPVPGIMGRPEGGGGPWV